MTDRSRREFLARTAAAAAGSAVFGRALVAATGGAPKVTPEMVKQAEWVSGLAFTDAERELMLKDVADALASYAALRAVPIDNAVPPAFRFGVLGVSHPGAAPKPAAVHAPAAEAAAVPIGKDELPWASIRQLAAALRARKISAKELTALSLERLKKHDPVLLCVVTRTDDIATKQAAAADEILARKDPRSSILLGIPWAAKDLVAVAGAKTTWGSAPYREQVRPETATVARRLADAGAVLVAKTSVGELAWGDVWFGGTTKNPWKTDQGSSGSSAGSASSVSAGLVPFAVGTETWGSIVSPSARCGCTGLRPTFGRVSRAGVMALSWTMDKTGVIARSAEDCGWAFSLMHGSDPMDETAVDRPFDWTPGRGLKGLRIGVMESLFAVDRTKDAKTPEEKAAAEDEAANDRATLATLRSMGAELVPVEPPKSVPVESLSIILTAEAATAFDDLVRSGRAKEMVRQTADAWPNVFRQGQLIPAVEYLRANRLRTLLMREVEATMAKVDVYVAPSFVENDQLTTNLTGHPALVVPNGFRKADGTPTSITFTGRLFGESTLLAVGEAFQAATDFHRKRPKGF